ncbi:MAG TPA: cupin domain-containing protein [Stellaceae bacterium]|nr:cupin domain-containing protein [Stellaceae bacterium]
MRHVKHLIIAACALVAIGGATALLTQAAEPAKTKPTELISRPLTGDPEREVKVINVILPAGADSGRHYHHGDQYTTVQEGEIHIDIEGKGDHVYKAGEAVHIAPMVVHRTQNLSEQPARTIEFFIVAKGKPLSEKAE